VKVTLVLGIRRRQGSRRQTAPQRCAA
jgi:hypothetical protein